MPPRCMVFQWDDTVNTGTAKKLKKATNGRNKTWPWTIDEEKMLISICEENESLVKTSSLYNKRHDNKKVAAREEIKRSLQS